MGADVQWRPALSRPLQGLQLAAGLFTTYRPAEASFLVEHLLPSLLVLNRSPTAEPEARALFFGELALELQRRRGKLSVFSSTAAEDRGSFAATPSGGAYPWLWRYVTPFTVGAQGAVVQHAKLWLLHWTTTADGEGEEALEVTISSTNLTEAAFKGQIQAGWRATLPLGPRRRDNRESWAPLTRFLEALGDAAGPGAGDRVEHFCRLLERCERPEGVAVVSSIPGAGQASRGRTGSRALGEQARHLDRGPLHLQIAAPFVGAWDAATLRAWCEDLGLDPHRVRLAWIPAAHPWAGEFRLLPATLEALRAQGVELERIGSASDGEGGSLGQTTGDERWSHAKLYGLRRGRVRRLLVTSANFSASAWGAGERRPRNFELGVLLEADWPIAPAVPFGDLEPHTSGDAPAPAPRVLVWASATWSGTQVDVGCRLENPTLPVSAELRLGPNVAPRSVPVAVRGEAGSATLPWAEPLHPPLSVVLRHGEEELEVAVVDARAEADFDRTPLPEVDPAVAEALRDALILERYGGPVVEPGEVGGAARGEPDSQAKGSVGPGDYSVASIEQARAWFRVVDAWRQAWERAGSEEEGSARERVGEDGRRLVELFKRKAGDGELSVRLPARLVAEELELRVKEASRG